MIPNLFGKLPIPKKIPKSMEKKIKEFAKDNNKGKFVKRCFDFLVSIHHGSRINMILKFVDLYRNNINYIWNHRGFFHCTTLNYILRIMLVKSNLFKDEDIELKISNTLYIAPHQYMKIKMDNGKFLNVDVWAYQFGIDFNDYGHGFHSGEIQPIR